MIDPGIMEQAFKKKSALTEEQQANAAKAKAAGPKAIFCNGEVVDLTNLSSAQIQFKGLVTQATKAGMYEGKSLTWTDGGRSSMMYDQARVDGLDHAGAKKAVADQFQKFAQQTLDSGTPEDKEKLQQFLNRTQRAT